MNRYKSVATHLLCLGLGLGIGKLALADPADERAQALRLLCLGSYLIEGGFCNDIRESIVKNDLNMAQLRLVTLKRSLETSLDGCDLIYPFSPEDKVRIKEWKARETAREAALPEPVMPTPPPGQPGQRKVVLPP